jgi:hypothetical protein
MKLLVAVFCIVRYPLFVVLSIVQFMRVVVPDEDPAKILDAMFSRIQESLIVKIADT